MCHLCDIADENKRRRKNEVEDLAQEMFGEKYSGYHDPGWDEVSELCRARFRSLAEKKLPE